MERCANWSETKKKCKALVEGTVCTLDKCSFYKTVEQAKLDREKSIERLLQIGWRRYKKPSAKFGYAWEKPGVTIPNHEYIDL